MNYIEFATNIKKKYPQYSDMEDLDLAKKMIAKYPQYNDVTFDEPEQKAEQSNILSDTKTAFKKIGSKIYDGVNAVTEPAVNAAKNINVVTDVIKKTINPINVIKNVTNKATIKEYNNTEPILRARTKADDNAKVIYEPDGFDILGNEIAVASAGGRAKNIEELKKLKNKQDFAVLSAQLPALALTGAMPVTVLAGFAGLQQLKNLIVTKAKGEEYSPMQIRMLAEMLPEDTNKYIKIGAGLLEAAGDTAVIGAGVNKFKRTLLTDAANNTIDKLKKAGYKITPEQEQQFKSAVDKRIESISPDDAVAINIKTKMAKVPEAAEKTNIEAKPLKADAEVNSETEAKIITEPAKTDIEPVNREVAPVQEDNVIQQGAKPVETTPVTQNNDVTNIDDDISFNTEEFEQQEQIDELESQSRWIDWQQEQAAQTNKSTLTEYRQALNDMGIWTIRRPEKGEPTYSEYKELSPRIKRMFFAKDDKKILMSWDEAEQLLHEHTGNDTVGIFEYLDDIDRATSGNYAGLAQPKKTDKTIIEQNEIEQANKKEYEDSLQEDKLLQKIDCPNTKPIDEIQITSGSFITHNNAQLHSVAKAGDYDKAVELVEKCFGAKAKEKEQKLMELKNKYPNAVIVPVYGIEKAGRNKIPLAYADKIAEITGLPIYDSIYQTNKTFHTGADAMDRMIDKATFTGKVVPNLEYILVDDIFTMGGNMNELRKYITRKGGNVVGISCLGAVQGGVHITDKDDKYLKMLYNNFDIKELNKFLQEENLANSVEELTRAEREYLTRFKSIDTIRDKLNKKRFKRTSGDSKEKGYKNLRSGLSLKKDKSAYSSVLKYPVEISPAETPQNKDLKLYQAVYDLAKKYQINNIAESKYRPKGTLGVYYNYGSGKGNIYLKSMINLDVAAHELAHALDDQYSLMDNLTNTEVINEIIAASRMYPRKLKGRDLQLVEGFATLIQHAIINPQAMWKRYPAAMQWMSQNETLNNFIKDGRQIVVDYENLTATQKVKSEIYDKPLQTIKKKKIPTSVIADSQFFDSEALFKYLDKDLYLAAKGYKTVLRGIIENNLANDNGIMYVIDKDGNPVKVADGCNWKTFINDVDKANSDFNTFLVARRFVGWYKKRDKLTQEIETQTNNLKLLQKQYEPLQAKIANNDFFTAKEQKHTIRQVEELKKEIQKRLTAILTMKSDLEKLTEIIRRHGKDEKTMINAFVELNTEVNNELAQKYDFLMNCNLTTMLNSGLINKELYNELKDNYGYAPFNKIAYNEIAGDGSEFVQKFAPKSQVGNLKAIKGSDLPIVSPLYSSVHLMTEAYRKSYRQIIANKIGDIADEFPELMQKVPYSKGMDKDSSIIIATDRKGKKFGIQVDPFIRRVFDEVTVYVPPTAVANCFLVPARIFTNMTTGLYPLYAPVNFIRDQITAFVNSRTDYIPLLSAINQYRQMITDESYKQFVDEYDNLFGVDNNTLLGTLTDIDPSELSRAFRNSKFKEIIKVGKKVIAFPANFSETITRRTEYANARKQGKSIIEAKRLADEITGAFGDKGLWFGKFGQVINKSIPYFNSTLQVVRQCGRTAENPKNRFKFLAATGLIAGAMVASSKAILDSENEEEKRQHIQLMAEQLAMYIYMPNGKPDGLIRIPIDQTYSWLGVLMTMVYNDMHGYDYKISDYVEGATAWLPEQLNFFTTVARMVESGDYSNIQKQAVTSLPHLFKTVVSGLFGKKTFPSIVDIVPKSLQNREPRMQYTEQTSDVAKYIGDKMNISPMKIDYFIKQGIGRSVSLVVAGIEGALNYAQTGKVDDNVKVLNPFEQQDYFNSGRIVQQFYDVKDKVDRLYNSQKNELRQLSDKEKEYITKYKGYTDRINAAMQNYNKFVKYIRDNKKKMSEAELKRNEAIKRNSEKEIFKLLNIMFNQNK